MMSRNRGIENMTQENGMHMSRRTLLQSGAAAALLSAIVSRALAQQQLELARVIVGFPAGGSTDAVARRLAERLQPGYASSVIVDNRVGAGGQIAVSAMKTLPADGSAMLVTPHAMLCIYPHTYKKLPYDPVKDVLPVSNAVSFDQGIGIGAAVPDSVKTLPQFLGWCKANPSKASFGSGSVGSTLHMGGALLGRGAGVDLTHVGYRGSSTLLNDVAGGSIPALVSPLGDMLTFHKAGKLRILATSGHKRSSFVPDVPTYVELGYKDLAFREWYAFFAPPRTPDAVVQRMNRAIHAALQAPEVLASLSTFALEATPSTSAELEALVHSDTERWGRLIRSVGFTAES